MKDLPHENPLWWTAESLKQRTDRQLREAISALESIYQASARDYYREQLTRSELENVFFLAQRLAELKTKGPVPTPATSI